MMKNTKFTPGPWFVSREVWSGGPIMNNGGCFSIVDSEDRHSANVICSRFPWDEKALELEANANLISAAPDLLEALKKCAAVCAGHTMHKQGLIDALESAKEAIAKATGEK